MRMNFTLATPLSRVVITVVIKMVQARRRRINFEIARLQAEHVVLEAQDALLTGEYGYTGDITNVESAAGV